MAVRASVNTRLEGRRRSPTMELCHVVGPPAGQSRCAAKRRAGAAPRTLGATPGRAGTCVPGVRDLPRRRRAPRGFGSWREVDAAMQPAERLALEFSLALG